MDAATLPHAPCANCSTAIVRGQNYCPICGQKAPTPRLSVHEIGAEFVHALTRIAAEVRLGHAARAKIAIDDFKTNLPSVATMADIKKWLHPSADLADFEPLYEGLRLAGISN